MHVHFYGVHGLISLAMFEDLAEGFRKTTDAQVTLEFPDLRMGLPEVATQICKARGYAVGKQQPDVMFVADFRCYPPQKCPVIDIGHGMGSKGVYWQKDTAFTSNFLFCYSDHQRFRLEHERGLRREPKLVSAGMPKLDRVPKGGNRDGHILIAPTHNPELNCFHLLESSGALAALAGTGRKIVLKPHVYHSDPYLEKSYRDGVHMKEVCKKLGIEYLERYNSADVLTHSSAVISDGYSVGLEAVGLGIPSVVCLPREMLEDSRKGLHNSEWEFLRCSQVFTGEHRNILSCLADARPALEIDQKMVLSHHGTSILRITDLVYSLAYKGEAVQC